MASLNPNKYFRLDDINFPDDIIIDILTELPVKSLLRFKRVCKSWNYLIQDDKFIKQHNDTHKNCQKYFMASARLKMNQFNFYHYTMDVPQLDSSSTASLLESPVPIDQLQMVIPNIQYFSSNGILLITYDDDIIVMWNPASRESRIIPCPLRSTDRMPLCDTVYNFCYFPCIDSFKIFRLGPGVVDGDMEIGIFSTERNMWKSIGPFPRNYYFFGSSVHMADGVVYMMARRKNSIDCSIVRFCLEKEQFQEELLCPFTTEGSRPILYSLGEKLCLCRTLGDNHKSREYWLYIMNINSWNNILTIPSPLNICLTPVSFMKDGNILFQKYDSSRLVVYNSATHKLEQVNVTGIEEGLYFNKVVTYVETLYSPNSLRSYFLSLFN